MPANLTRRRLLLQAMGAIACAARAHAAEPGAASDVPLPPKVSPLSPDAAAKLTALPGKAVFGTKGAPPLVTELVDYNAPDWRRSALDMRELLSGDAQLAYAVVQTPRYDVRSLEAARVALAVLAKDRARFETFYLALAESSGPIDGPAALDVAGHMGLDRFVLFNVSVQPENTQTLTQAAAFAAAVRVLETPAYVIGGKVIEGYIDIARKRALIAEARA